MEFINSLPQPFFVHFGGGDEWPVLDIDVETGCLCIDVCGKVQIKHIEETIFFRDSNGTEHNPESFYSDFAPPLPGRAVPDASLKLRAFCEGLGIQHIDELFTFGQVGDFRRLGERMAQRIKEIKHIGCNTHEGSRIGCSGLRATA